MLSCIDYVRSRYQWYFYIDGRFFVKIVYWANNSDRGARVEADNKQSFITVLFLPAFKVVHWLVPSRLLVTRAAGRRGGGAAGAEGDGKGKGRKTTSLSLAFLPPITPLAPLRRDRERRLGTSQGCGYKLKWAVASRSLNTGSWVLLRVFTIYTRLAYKSSSNFFTSAKRRR